MSAERDLEAGRVPSVDDPHLQKVIDKDAVREVMLTYCRSLDRLDEEMLRSVFWPDSTHNMGFTGPSNDLSLPNSPSVPGDFCHYAIDVLKTYHKTHHFLGNILVEVEGEEAFTEAYFTAFHRMKPAGMPGAAANAWDTEMDSWVAGRYMDRMEKRDNVWKITHRSGLTDWTRIEPPTSSGGDQAIKRQSGTRGHGDLIFNRRKVYSEPGKMNFDD